jgi:hypothetical protein
MILCIPLTLLGQRFQGGIMAGLNVSQIDGDLREGYNKAGLAGGAFVSTEFTPKWGVRMDIRYAEKGSATSKDNPVVQKFRLQYIEIPLLATYEMVNKLSFQWGISYGYLFSAAQNDGSGYFEFNELPNQNEMAVCAGINYSALHRLDVNARFSYSLFPVWANYSGATYGTRAWFNNVVTFGFYYWIGKRD